MMTFEPPRLGPGAVYLRSLDRTFRSHSDLIRVAEIEPQSLWTKGTASDARPRGSPMERRALSTLPQRVLIHGVGYPIGGTVCDQDWHLDEFRRWSGELEPAWTSEHLSILQVKSARGELPCGFLMPPLQTDAYVELAAENIRKRRAALGLPFAFETGVNYFTHRECEMSDGDFFAAIAEAADCGILLDLTNLWVNDRNGRVAIDDVLCKIPVERVWEVHVAGIEFAHGHWLDAHCGEIPPELVQIATDFISELPHVGAVIFELAPDRVQAFGEKDYLRQLETLHRLWDLAPRAAVNRAGGIRPRRSGWLGPTPETWEALIAGRMLPAAERPHQRGELLETRECDERSFTLYSKLAESFRAGAIAELLENTTRLLLIALGEQELRKLVERYLAGTAPVMFPSDEAIGFRRFVETASLSVPGLEDMLRFEAGLVEAVADSSKVHVTIRKNIDVMLADLAAGRLPGASSDIAPTKLEIGVDPAPYLTAVG